MMRALASILGALGLCTSCEGRVEPSEAPPQPAEPTSVPAAPTPTIDATTIDATTIDAFFRSGTPTFVLGTRGDATADLRIATQVALVRDLVLPDAQVVADTAVDLARGPSSWPPRPILYGGADTHALVAALGASLPLQVDDRRIELGGHVFEGEGYRIVAVVPAGAGHPELLLYAGTGEAGIAEINASMPSDHAIVVADAFGPLVMGTWTREGEQWIATLGPQQRRIEYRELERELAGAEGTPAAVVRFRFPHMIAASDADGPLVDACMRGLATVVRTLEIDAPVSLTVYVYPDRNSKQQLTGNGGDGHAVPSSRALHVLATDPAKIEPLVAHEGTHVLGYFALGPAGTPMMGEGMAVWVSGSYGGQSLDAWRAQLAPRPPSALMGPQWLQLAEHDQYPAAALVFDAAVAELGLAEVGRHLLPATSETWAAQQTATGAEPGAIERRLEAQRTGR